MVVNLSNLNALLTCFYVDIINDFIGGEKTIQANKVADPQTMYFLRRLADAISVSKEQKCCRKCIFRKGDNNE